MNLPTRNVLFVSCLCLILYVPFAASHEDPELKQQVEDLSEQVETLTEQVEQLQDNQSSHQEDHAKKEVEDLAASVAGDIVPGGGTGYKIIQKVKEAAADLVDAVTDLVEDAIEYYSGNYDPDDPQDRGSNQADDSDSSDSESSGSGSEPSETNSWNNN